MEYLSYEGLALYDDKIKAYIIATHNNKSILDLTTASFTEALKTKLDSIDSSLLNKSASDFGQIDVVKVNGTPLSVSNKTVDVILPTKLSDLTDDLGTNPIHTHLQYLLSSNFTASNIKTTLGSTAINRAIGDGSGNSIVDTYATKAALTTVQNLAEGRMRAASYATLIAARDAIKSASNTGFKVGDNIYIQAIDVPDLWIYSVETTSSAANDTITEANFISELNSTGYVQLGYYKVSKLETSKVDLSNYVTKISGKSLSENDFTSAYKTKIDGIASGANNYSHPTYTSIASGLYKITVDSSGHVSNVASVAKADITALGVPAQDTVYTHPSHTAYTSGLYKFATNALGHIVSATSVLKADITALGIPAENTWRGISDTLTSTDATVSLSANQGRALKVLVDGKASATHNHTLSNVTDFATSFPSITNAQINSLFE